MTIVYMFPGQNSRYAQMIDHQRQWKGCERILQEASDILGRDVNVHYRADNSRIFSRNRDVQIGVFLASYILRERLAATGIRCDASLGLSLGEYNHLVEIGALSFTSALRLLDARGCAYEDGPRGLMVSVLPCDAEQVKQALESTAGAGAADLAIELSAKHFVIGGEAGAVQAAAAWLEEEAFAQTRLVESALPMHSRLFQPAADAFMGALEKTDWMPARNAYLPNIDGEFLIDARPSDYVDRLYRHVFSTVRWGRSVAAIVSRYPDAMLVEVGPKCVLYNVVSREYKGLSCFCTDDPESATPVLLNTIQRLQEAHNAA
jgi:[acyl-carrier-protein] S-malonyltransferase